MKWKWTFLRTGIAVAALSVFSPLYAHDSGMGLVRYNPDGTLDAGFGRGGVVAERTVQGGLTPEALAIEPDGKIILAGTASDLASASVGFGLARYTADGTLDTSFGAGGRLLTRVGAATAEAHAVALQPDGDILVAGGGFGAGAESVSNFALARYTPDGSPDNSFGVNGAVLTQVAASGAEARAIALQSDGRIVVAGTAFASATTIDALALARYNADGSPDPTFGSSGSVLTSFDSRGDNAAFRAAALVVQVDGKLVGVGSVGGHQAAFALARFLPNGALDPAFGAGDGKVTTPWASSAQAYAAILQPDGNVVVAGGVGPTPDSVAFGLARYLPSGDLDSSFGGRGLVSTAFDGGGSGAHALVVEADGKLLATGSGYAQAASSQGAVNGGFGVVRYLPNGVADTTFAKTGVALTTVGDAGSTPGGLAVQADGKLVATGLTYFLIPTPGVGGLTVSQWLVVLVAALIILAVLIGAWLLRWKRARIAPAPGASQLPR